jgi:hypothetical protein
MAKPSGDRSAVGGKVMFLVMFGWRQLAAGVQHILVVDQQLMERGWGTPHTDRDATMMMANEAASRLLGMTA